ncbi:unnamed protein product, partial [Didymodactylos carnosus]
MASVSTSVLTTTQLRKFSARTQAHMKKRVGGNKNLYKELYSKSGKNLNGEITINEQFVQACENGDYNTVNRILEERKNFNIDVTDQLGRTAM